MKKNKKAKQEAIAFAKWINKYKYEPIYPNNWINHSIQEILTTEELYKEFKNKNYE